MRCLISIFVVFMVLAANSAAQERISGFRPSSEPDRIILTITGDPSTTMAVTWRTDTTVNESVTQLSHNLPTIFLADSSSVVTGTFVDVEGDGVIGRFHSVNFTSLRPGTTYAYRVGSGTDASEWFTFTTASAAPDPYTFLFFGDSQMGTNSLYSRVIRQAYRSVPGARLMIFPGDLVDGGSGSKLQDDEWGEWHAADGFINAEIPVMPTPGNHEYYNPADRSRRELNRYWRPGFTLPENGPAGLEETSYTIDYQGVRFIVLNSDIMLRSEEFAGKQALWVEDLLKNNPCKWTIMTFHHPLFSTSARRDNKVVRELLKPLIDKYRVDLVLNGHDHTYARGSVMPDGEVKRSKRAGTVYVVSVSGSKQYQQDAEPWWDIGLINTQMWQAITVDGNELEYRAYDASGALVDQFILKKKNNGNTIITEAR
ncbi:MAG: metallophosphoesterase family protein [Bacteroidales bacterium]|nr:metallophosphoesterase family protein [Bacteroidales bacterium]